MFVPIYYDKLWKHKIRKIEMLLGVDKERTFRTWALLTTFLDYQCRSCLKCSSIRNRIACRTYIRQRNVHRCLLLRQNGMYEHFDGSAWIIEKYLYNILSKNTLLLETMLQLIATFCARKINREPVGELRLDEEQQQEEQFEERRQGDVERQAEEEPMITELLEIGTMSANIEEQAEHLQEIRAGLENYQQIDDSDIQDEAREDPSKTEVFHNVENTLKSFFLELTDHKNRRKEPPSHLKCRMFLSELIGRQTGRPMRRIDMIALVDKAIPDCLHHITGLYEVI